MITICPYLVRPNKPMMTNPLLSKLRPWCIGRFVFDRPTASEISNQRYVFRGEKLETWHNVSFETYQTKVAELETKLQTERRLETKDNKGKPTNQARLEKKFSPSGNSDFFIYTRSHTNEIKSHFKSEGFIFNKDKIFHVTGIFNSDTLNKFEDSYINLYRHIKPRDNWSVPTESGFCFDGGIVTGSASQPEEVSQSFALMPGQPAVLMIQMRTAATVVQSEPLANNLPDLHAQLVHQIGNSHILRQGKRPVAEMEAEEVLFALKDGEVTSYRFYLLASGDASTRTKPHTAIQLLLGGVTPEQTASPVDEAEALQIWEMVLNSLRLRPTSSNESVSQT